MMSYIEQYKQEIDFNFEACLKLGNAIVEEAGRNYCRAYQEGNSNDLSYAKRFLESEQVSILTANRTNGKALLEKLEKRCFQEYGDFALREQAYKQKLIEKDKEHKQAVKYRNVKFIFVLADNTYFITINKSGLKTTRDYNNAKIRFSYAQHKIMRSRLKKAKITYELIKEKKESKK